MAASPARPTIGFLTSGIGAGVGLGIWSGVVQAAEDLGADLYTLVGGSLQDPVPYGSQANIVYGLPNPRCVDGLLIWGSSIGGFVAPSATASLCQRYAPLPVVNITLPLPGIPTSLIDSYRGMHDLVMHLIGTHDLTRLAFIRGPETHYYARERLRAFTDALSESGLSVDARRITPPLDWTQVAGSRAISILLDQRALRPGHDLDALVAANDGLALGAIEALCQRGIQVPRDLAVVGFNDSQAGRVCRPPLTSVAQPFHQQGRQTVQMLLDQLAGQAVPESVTLQPHLVVRQSCGCPDLDVADAAVASSDVDPGSLRTLVARRAQVVADLAGLLTDLTADRALACAQGLFDSFVAELRGASPQSFLPALESALASADPDTGFSPWHRLLSRLRLAAASSLDQLSLRLAENLFQQSRVLLAKHASRAQIARNLKAEQQAIALRDIGAALATCSDIPSAMEVLARSLPSLGITAGFLTLYETPTPWSYPQPPPEWSTVATAFGPNAPLGTVVTGLRFRSSEIRPAELLPGGSPCRCVILPLYFRDHQLGLLGLEVGPRDGTVYESLRIQVSSALEGLQLLEQNVGLYHQSLAAEKAADQGRRAAEEANSLKSRFLSMVSHELLTPLVLLVGLSEMMLKSTEGDAPLNTEQLRQDLRRMYSSSEHLGSLVRDVLDLARSQVGELQLVRRPLDLARMLRSVALVGEELARSKGLDWRVDLPAHLPIIDGDEARLRQVTLNLLTNAVKFTARGYVSLSAECDDHFVTVRVRDTGLGVPAADQRAIFDEFRQSERTAARGFGGLGIGLAICRRLIALHDGLVGVESAGGEDSGSTFYYRLPLHRGAIARPYELAQPSRVLIVVEHVSDAAILERFLRQSGFTTQVIALADAPFALNSLIDDPPGAVVLDVSCSIANQDLAVQLSSHPTLSTVPLLLVALAAEQDGGALLPLDSLSKPIRPEGLAAALERYGIGSCAGDAGPVLVVEDEPEQLALHCRLVEQALPGARVCAAANGLEALEQLRTSPPALVLLDLRMPGLDGFGVLQEMSSDPHLARIPVIVLTARSLDEQDMARLTRSVVAVLAKGTFTAQETLQRIKAVLSAQPRLGTETQRVVRRAMAFVHEHYAEPLTRRELASAASVSPRHLDRCFSEALAISPMTYLYRHRIGVARRLLDEDQLTITGVALAVGFSSSSYFAEMFRRETGVSPSAYRARHQ